MKILVSGAAGFIGFHLCRKLLEDSNNKIYGFDNLNSYYDKDLKLARLKILKKSKNFFFKKIDLCNRKKLKIFFELSRPNYVIHLAAQAGVRFSISNPEQYITANINGFFNIIDLSKDFMVKHFMYASSSSVYGLSNNSPFHVDDYACHPTSIYAATKKSNELIAHSYSHIYNLPTTGLRFFSVYGPWGRPDMAYFLFANLIKSNKKINLFNYGKMTRDFTYIDDAISAIVNLLDKIPKKNKVRIKYSPSTSVAPYSIFNIGNNNPVKLISLVRVLEKNLNKRAKINYLQMQPGDVKKTFSDNYPLDKFINFKPKFNLEDGIKNFVEWFNWYYS